MKTKYYSTWIRKREPSAKELAGQAGKGFPYEPRISIVVPVFETPQKFLKEMINSVAAQTYPNWELCIADGGSKVGHVRKILEEYSGKDARIKVKYLTENKGIAGNSNEGVSLATGDFIALLDHDDTLAPFALHEVVRAVNENPDAEFLYSDEDKITESGNKRYAPHFKPDWSPDTLRSYNYICHLSVFNKELLDKAGYFRGGFEGSQDYDLILRATEMAKRVVHIPKVLYHWRAIENSTSKNPEVKLYAYESAKKALREHLSRVGLTGEVEDGLFLGGYKIIYETQEMPKVSILIPTKDNLACLRKCVDSILQKTSYKDYEIIIVDNNSTRQETYGYYNELSKFNNVRVIAWNNPFNYSAINNFAVEHAKGDIILLLNNDIEVITPDWMECMLMHVLRKEVGAVGAKLYYPDDTIQHAGVIVGLGGIAGHHHKHFPKDSGGYFSRLKVVQNLSAVTGACLMMRSEVFKEAGGFDETLSYAFNDVDLCMKIRQKGYLVVWTPYAELYHHESKTRGYDDTPEKQDRFKKEIGLFRDKWGDILEKGDPYYNPNLSLKTTESFSVKIDERSTVGYHLFKRTGLNNIEIFFRKKIRNPIRDFIRQKIYARCL